MDGIKASGIGGSLFCVIAFLAIAVSRKSEHLTTTEIVIAGVLAVVYCLIIIAFRNKEKLMAVTAPVIILAVSGGELIYNSYNTFKDEDADLIYSTHTSWYNFINNGREVTQQLYNYDPSFYRAEKTFHRTVNDNSAFGLRGISHSSSVMNAPLLKFIEALGYSASTYYTRYDGNTPISDSLLGIKYSMDRNTVGDDNAFALPMNRMNLFSPITMLMKTAKIL